MCPAKSRLLADFSSLNNYSFIWFIDYISQCFCILFLLHSKSVFDLFWSGTSASNSNHQNNKQRNNSVFLKKNSNKNDWNQALYYLNMFTCGIGVGKKTNTTIQIRSIGKLECYWIGGRVLWIINFK